MSETYSTQNNDKHYEEKVDRERNLGISFYFCIEGERVGKILSSVTRKGINRKDEHWVLYATDQY